MMGSTVVRGETEGTVEFTGVDTFFGKTASLLQVRITATNCIQGCASRVNESLMSTSYT